MASNQPEWDTEGSLALSAKTEVTETQALRTNFETQLYQVKNHIFETVKAMSGDLVSVKRELTASKERSADMLSDLRVCQKWGIKVRDELSVRDAQYYEIQRDLVKAQQRADVAEQRADVAESKIISMEKEFQAEREMAGVRDRRVIELAALFEEMKLQLGR